MTGGWRVEHHEGPAAWLHALELPVPVPRAVWWMEVDRPAVALGSAQSWDELDVGEDLRYQVARRRSGGGAVLLVPGEVTWVDVLLPVHDPLWEDDVTRSFLWLGEVWAEVLEGLGRSAVVHRGPLVRDRWSDLVCFGGLGSGEVTVDGRKVVGLSQRRTRTGARFQCAVLHAWHPEDLLRVLALDPDERREGRTALAGRAGGIAVERGTLEQAFEAALATR